MCAALGSANLILVWLPLICLLTGAMTFLSVTSMQIDLATCLCYCNLARNLFYSLPGRQHWEWSLIVTAVKWEAVISRYRPSSTLCLFSCCTVANPFPRRNAWRYFARRSIFHIDWAVYSKSQGWEKTWQYECLSRGFVTSHMRVMDNLITPHY